MNRPYRPMVDVTLSLGAFLLWTATEGEAAAVQPAEEPIMIVAKAWPGSPFETESIQAAIDKFREEYPHYTIDWQTEPQAYSQKVLTQSA